MGSRKFSGYDYDAVIIGAGIGGLVTGAFLARQGVKVLVCEQHAQPGGYFTSFKRKGFSFDGGIQGCEDGGMFFNMLESLGLLDRIEFRKSHFAMASPDFFLPVYSVADVRAFYQELKQVYPHESEAIDRIAREAGECCEFMIAFNQMPTPMFSPPLDALKQLPAWVARNRDTLKYAGTFFRNMSLTLEEYLSRNVRDPGLRRFLSQMSYSGSPASFGFSFVTFLMDYYYPLGGVQVIPDLLAETITTNGGSLRCGTLVEEILIENGRAQGVRLAGGEVLRAPFIVSNSDARNTYLKMLPSGVVPEAYRDGVSRAELSESFFTVFLGVDMPPEELPARGFSHVLYFPDYQGVDSLDYGPGADPEVYARAPVEINIPSLNDPGLAPKGKSVVVIQAAARDGFMDRWGTRNGKRTKKYRAVKEKVADQLIATADKVLPGLADRIVYRLAATPLTFERYTLNSGGASVGWTFHPEKSFNAGLKGFVGFNPPVPRLFQVGHWSMSPGGAPSGLITGRLVSQMIGKRLQWGV